MGGRGWRPCAMPVWREHKFAENNCINLFQWFHIRAQYISVWAQTEIEALQCNIITDGSGSGLEMESTEARMFDWFWAAFGDESKHC